MGICLGLTAPSSLYGKLMPYLHSIDLHEHYYIQGPLGCEAEARQLFGRMGERALWFDWLHRHLDITLVDIITIIVIVVISIVQYLINDLIRMSTVSCARSTERIQFSNCLLYTSPSPRDGLKSRMPSSA